MGYPAHFLIKFFDRVAKLSRENWKRCVEGMVVYPGVGMLLFIGLVKTGFSFSWFYSIMILDRWCWYRAYKLCFRNIRILQRSTWCPKKHGNSVTNWISSLLGISIVKPNFKSHNIIMSPRFNLMKMVKDCKDVFVMSLQDEQ